MSNLCDCPTTVRAAYDSNEIFAQLSHDVRAISFSCHCLEMVLFMLQSIAFVSHICRIVQITESK